MHYTIQIHGLAAPKHLRWPLLVVQSRLYFVSKLRLRPPRQHASDAECPRRQQIGVIDELELSHGYVG
jgi:hypothetical protein